MKKRILVIAPTGSDTYELQRPELWGTTQPILQPYEGTYFERILSTGIAGDFERTSPVDLQESLLALVEEYHIDGVMSTDDYPGCLYASIIASVCQFPGPHIAALLHCSHKYLSRCLQRRVVPEATPPFALVHQKNVSHFHFPYPLFLKPLKSYFSVNAGIVTNKEELHHRVSTQAMPSDFLYQYQWFLRHYGATEYDAQGFIAEEVLHGFQVTVEGFVFNHTVTIMGIVDSLMYPGTISFERFRYPSHLDISVQERMGAIAERAILGANLNTMLFNIEMMYDLATDRISIIEINPRMAQYFSDLYEKADGTNAYEIALTIAGGQTPNFKRKQGTHRVSSSFVMRLFEDKKVVHIPSEKEIQAVMKHIPDARIYICATQGKKLSYFLQDGSSFRYMLLNLGGRDEQDLQEKKDYCLRSLPFTFT